jgi:hypothetical protein
LQLSILGKRYLPSRRRMIEFRVKVPHAANLMYFCRAPTTARLRETAFARKLRRV